MTLAHPERIQIENMAGQDPESRFTGDALDELLKDFPMLEDSAVSAPALTAEEARDKAAESDALLFSLTENVRQAMQKDVLRVDEEHRFTFADLERRLPFDGFRFNDGIVVLSDNILTTRERNRRVEAHKRAEKEGLPHNENFGTQYARDVLDGRLKELGFNDHARHIAQLALSELCANTSIHGEGIKGIAGRCEAQYFPDIAKLVITAINVSSRPKQRKEDDTRGVQEKGRGLYTLAGFLREEDIGDNMGRFRYNDAIIERFIISPAAEVAGIGRTATFAVIDKDLIDNSKNDPSAMESPNPKVRAQQDLEQPADKA